MSKLSQKWEGVNKRKAGLIALVAVFLIALPMFAFSSRTHKIYVDNDASGTQDGSKSHPYKTISKAISEANGKTEIHVDNGIYKENITLKSNMELYGENKNNTIIEANEDGDSVVTMKDDTVINKVTIKGGTNGIKIREKASAEIIKCVIMDNDRDGIRVESDGTGDSRKVSISENTIKDNGWAGIYAGRRNLSIMDNDIYANNKDGIDIAKGSKAWISGNTIKDNRGSGMKLAIDGSDIWTKSNDLRNNKREGLEVSFSGAAGKVNIAKSKIRSNGRYGIARVQDFPINANSENLWKRYLTFDNANEFYKNDGGNISVVIVRN
ncbi:MAG: right-handed parallel beta-helix repeat-containing protein [Parcubacteria group bacterium]